MPPACRGFAGGGDGERGERGEGPSVRTSVQARGRRGDKGRRRGALRLDASREEEEERGSSRIERSGREGQGMEEQTGSDDMGRRLDRCAERKQRARGGAESTEREEGRAG